MRPGSNESSDCGNANHSTPNVPATNAMISAAVNGQGPAGPLIRPLAVLEEYAARYNQHRAAPGQKPATTGQ